MHLPKRCWNCRTRKVACDRRMPACSTCLSRGVSCEGYGTKLSWPVENDQRRLISNRHHTPFSVIGKSLHFVTAGTWDVEISQRLQDTTSNELYGNVRESPSYVPRHPQDIPFGLNDIDPFQSSQGHNAVAQVLTTKGDKDTNLYGLIARMTLESNASAAIAVRHALTTLSFHFLGDNLRAREHQGQAMRALQITIDKPLPLDRMEAFQAIAASMLLNICETMDLSGSPLSWAVFFCGTKRLTNLVHQPGHSYDGDTGLIIDWVFYHDTMYKFSILHWLQKQHQHMWLAQQNKIVSKAETSPMRRIILPSLGCSLEMLSLLCEIFDNVFDRADKRFLSPAHKQRLQTLERRLRDITQTEVSEIDKEVDVDNEEENPSHASQVAESYRLAALVYLERVARNTSQSATKVTMLSEKAFKLLMKMQGLERPWPLFVLALEATGEDKRRIVLDVLDGGEEYRGKRGNLATLRRMVEAAWTQQDLAEGSRQDMLDLYNAVVSANYIPPSFT